MTLTLNELFASPDHYLHSFEGDAAIFMQMDRAAYHRSIFLDGRISPRAPGALRVPAAMLAPAASQAAATGWIFHVAHCGSTLLARALDDPQANLVLREPLALRQLAIAPDADRLRIVPAMLGKRYAAALPTLVKANVPVNFLLDQLLAADPQARAILLYAGLADYLLAILRSDNHREWLGRVTAQLAPHLGDLSDLSDAERAAALWLAQMRAFARRIAASRHARGLDAERFFAEPAPVLRRAADHLEIRLTDAAIAERVAGPLFATYSKNPSVEFDNAARLERRRELEQALAGEIAAAERWIAAQGEDAESVLAPIRAAAL